MTTRDAMRNQLRIKPADLEAVNAVLAGPDNTLVDGLLELIEKYGGVAEINRKAHEAGLLETRLARLQDEASPFLAGLQWLTEQRDAGAFVSLPEYRRSVLGPEADAMAVDEHNAVTLEISALQYFPWLITEAKQAIAQRELMPGRYIRVRTIAEQTAPGEDILAVAAAMQIIGATHVETLDTKGIDGSNVHLGGARHDRRLLRRHRPAQRLSAEVGRRVPRRAHHVRHPPGPQHQQRHHPRGSPDAQAGDPQ